MYFANDENGLRVHIDEATKAGAYTCPACKEPVIMKCGRIVAHHFSHKERKNCDPWYTGKMSAWHRKLQNVFPLYSQEKVVWNTDHTVFHIADVLFEYKGITYVLEFQHSPMSRKEFDLRSRFYLDLGYRLIWIFDFCDTDPPKKILYKAKDSKQKTISLIWPSQDRVRFLDNLNMLEYANEKQFHVFFHISTGLGHEVEHSFSTGYTWYKWEYVDPFFRERYFVEPCFLEWEHLDEFEALYYEEKEFFEILAQYAAKMKSDSTINTQ